MEIHFELYYVFYVVADSGNITKASHILHISQPAVSKQIQNLETALGGDLFIRTKRGVILTEMGQTIFQYTKNAVAQIQMAQIQICSLKALQFGTVKIGSSTTLVREYLLPYLQKFHADYPQVGIQIFTDPTSVMKKKLRVGEIDFIVSKKPYSMESDLLFIPIGILHNCFVVNSLYPDLIHETVPVSDLVKYPILLQSAPSSSHDSIIQFCLQHNVELHSIMDIASSSLLVDFVKIGLGVGYVIKEYVSKELEQRELFIVRTNPVLPTEEFGILFLKNTPLSFSSNCLYSLILDDKKTF